MTLQKFNEEFDRFYFSKSCIIKIKPVTDFSYYERLYESLFKYLKTYGFQRFREMLQSSNVKNIEGFMDKFRSVVFEEIGKENASINSEKGSN